MEPFDWRAFLERWSREWLEDEWAVEQLPPEVVASGWLGYPGATEEQLAQLESYLERALPPSYRAFLKVSDGWRWVTDDIDHLWSTEEIGWFAVRNQESIDGWMHTTAANPLPDADYFVYGDEQNSGFFRAQYLQTAVQISEWDDSDIYLLNPEVVTPEGEWEAWLVQTWLPGVQRYRSFQELMQAEHDSFLESRQHEWVFNGDVADETL